MTAAPPDEGAAAPRYTTRAAQPVDAPAIAAIYNQGIADRIATFETEPRSAEDISDLPAEEWTGGYAALRSACSGVR
jgi:L-amino acid N-acyltransferase YncA